MADETDLFGHHPAQGSLFGAGGDRLHAAVARNSQADMVFV